MWYAYGLQHFMCVPTELANADDHCSKQVSSELGVDIECECTADPAFMQDMCKAGGARGRLP